MGEAVRDDVVGLALESYRELISRLPGMTLAEVERAFDVELSTQRREAVLEALRRAAVNRYNESLKRKMFHG